MNEAHTDITATDPLALLTEFGLARQEAAVYLALLSEGPMNGYEVTKVVGISRSNAYTALASLVDKGAAWTLEGSPTRYTPVPAREFTDNRLSRLASSRERLIACLPEKRELTGGYVTIKGEAQILDRLRHLILETEERLYLSLDSRLLEAFRAELSSVAASGKRLVVIASRAYLERAALAESLPGAELHGTPAEPTAIRAIADSRFVLSGETPSGPNASCLFSDERNLVELFKSALKNEITLADLAARKELP
jgi:sugar-specific transcriptional regulator TrmB